MTTRDQEARRRFEQPPAPVEPPRRYEATAPDGTRLEVVPDDPSGTMLAPPTFAVVGRFREHEAFQVAGAGRVERAANETARSLVNRSGWHEAHVVAVERVA